MSIFSHISAGISGFMKGGYVGGVAGLIAGKNTPRTANMKPKAKTTNTTTAVGNYSANPYVRVAASNGIVSMPSASALAGPGGAPSYSTALAPYGGGGATGTWTPESSAAGVPMWAYRRLYTKKGTPRRTRHDGMPYAVPRMNPMNVRAARRAIRRIRGARKLLQRIERSLPKARSHTTRRRAA